MCIRDSPRTGRPKSCTTPEIINKVHDIVLEDRRLKMSEIVKPVSISDERVHQILTEELGMKKLSARWVLRLLTSDHKCMQIQAFQECLDCFKKNPKDFIHRFVTTDETWVHYFTLETKNSRNNGCIVIRRLQNR